MIDFCLSNLTNAGITNINVVANYNYRSLVDHIGSGKDWDLARRTGGINLISPYSNANSGSAKMFSTRMQALKSMRDDIAKIKEEYVVLMDSDQVLNIDIDAVIESHKKTKAQITIVTKNISPKYTSKTPRMMISSSNGKINDIALSSTYNEKNPELALNIFVMSTTYLQKIIEEAEAYSIDSLTSIITQNVKKGNYYNYSYSGYVATVSSFLDYYRCSMELINDESSRESLLWQKDFPIFTRVHNSAPTLHMDTASVENSMIADECVIEGKVIDSIIFRGVHVEKGATVKNSILFHGTHVGKNATLNCIVTDKDVWISDNVTLSGNDNMPFYIQKNRKV
jgi:glucose-1-phosphate adenylyltransferase